MEVNRYGKSVSISQSKPAMSSPSIGVLGGKDLSNEMNKSDKVNISESARLEMLEELHSGQFIDFTDENGPFKLGLLALGDTAIQGWAGKGLSISDEAIITAGKVFNIGLKKKFEENGSSLSESGGLALNKHQIVINSQDVPEWFIREYEDALSSMDNVEMKMTFEKGDLFFSSKQSARNVNALASYTLVAKDI
ncbi:hypothetical protein H5202_23430 [Shewanella sp. SG41-4]|uniref:hypothetical protein n=1 Tax=Shewanella sp. SG41-4 TaxID=2760976 RepID=UPI0015FEC9A6|nr:hypothetical protein [Shewanella sp. SG41-4]MBB1441511.1 hypothetical protein [Shewanella sp. SG41-4]